MVIDGFTFNNEKIDLFERDLGWEYGLYNPSVFDEKDYWPKKVELLTKLFNI